MKLFSTAALAAAALTASAGAQGGVWTQSVDNATLIPGSVSCLNNPAGVTDNSFWRSYDPVLCGLTGNYEVSACTFGVENSMATSGMTTITVNLRAANPMFPAGGGTDPILGTTTVDVMNTDITAQTFVSATFTPPVFVFAGTVIAVEVMAPDGQPQGDFFFIGSNNLGETAPSYISAFDCGIIDPLPYAVVGFPDIHCVIDLECAPAGPPPISYICQPPSANSTGMGASMSYSGNRDISMGPYTATLTTTEMPLNQFGYYIASREMRAPLAVGQGNLCLGGDIARLIGAGQPGVQNSGATGMISAVLDTANIPTNPNRAILPGDTWYFQTWYRDNPNSNLSDACCIPFF